MSNELTQTNSAQLIFIDRKQHSITVKTPPEAALGRFANHIYPDVYLAPILYA